MGKYEKEFFLLVLLFVLFAHSQAVFENADCNIVGNPQNSCSITFSRFSFDPNFGTNGTNMYGSNPAKIENHRSILYFGGSFWVIFGDMILKSEFRNSN